MGDIVLARWESRGGAHWVELLWCISGRYCYRGNGCGGSLPSSEAEAFNELEQKIASGYFLPDNAKTPMRRVK